MDTRRTSRAFFSRLIDDRSGIKEDRLYKKKKSQTYAERSEEKRKEFLAKTRKFNVQKLVYIDESGMNNNDYYPYAYSAIGKRHYESHAGWSTKRLSMIGALCNNRFMAPLMFEGHCTTEVFENYVEKVLVPELRAGMIVIMDNASFHKSAKITDLLKKAKAKLIYLPPYSPDLNPIEHYWYKIKTSIRKLMRNSKIILENAMQATLKQMSQC